MLSVMSIKWRLRSAILIVLIFDSKLCMIGREDDDEFAVVDFDFLGLVGCWCCCCSCLNEFFMPEIVMTALTCLVLGFIQGVTVLG